MVKRVSSKAINLFKLQHVIIECLVKLSHKERYTCKESSYLKLEGFFYQENCSVTTQFLSNLGRWFLPRKLLNQYRSSITLSKSQKALRRNLFFRFAQHIIL